MMFMPMFSPTITAAAGVTMVAGASSSTLDDFFGYAGPGSDFPENFGSLDGQPVAGQALVALAYTASFGGYTLIEFSGDASAALSVFTTFYVDEVAYTLPTPFYSAGEGMTFLEWFGDGPTLANGHSYNIRIE